VIQRDQPIEMEMVGQTRGSSDIPIRARVEGVLLGTHFVEVFGGSITEYAISVAISSFSALTLSPALAAMLLKAPDVSVEPYPPDAIGESISSNASKTGLGEMVGRNGSFGVRFIFLQAQATRMVYAIAAAAAEIDPNEERAKWLTALGAEYEGYRDELVVIVEKYIMQEGAAQEN
jgi:hypothetical protein